MARRAVNTRPLSKAIRRMQIPLRRIRQGFETRDVRTGGRYGKLWWKSVDGARGGGVFGFLTDPAGWGAVEPPGPQAAGPPVRRPPGPPPPQPPGGGKGALFRTRRP